MRRSTASVDSSRMRVLASCRRCADRLHGADGKGRIAPDEGVPLALRPDQRQALHHGHGGPRIVRPAHRPGDAEQVAGIDVADDDLLPVGRRLLDLQAPVQQQEEFRCRWRPGGRRRCPPRQAARPGERQHRVDVLGRNAAEYLETADERAVDRRRPWLNPSPRCKAATDIRFGLCWRTKKNASRRAHGPPIKHTDKRIGTMITRRQALIGTTLTALVAASRTPVLAAATAAGCRRPRARQGRPGQAAAGPCPRAGDQGRAEGRRVHHARRREADRRSTTTAPRCGPWPTTAGCPAR